jgi:6-phosphogluconate dehydrogenase
MKITKIGIFGLGRMGRNMALSLIRSGYQVVAYNRTPDKTNQLAAEGAIPAFELTELVAQLPIPRAIWLMVPAGEPTELAIEQLSELLADGDIIIDDGNTHYIDDIRWAKDLALRGIKYVDVGTSGGVWGLERGYSGSSRQCRDNSPSTSRTLPV